MSSSAAPPEVHQDADEAVERSSGYCRLRGFGGHTTQDTGLSFWVHPYFLAATRFASFLILIVLAILMSISDPVESSVNIFAWTFYLEAATFLMLAICSVRAGLDRGAGILPNLVAPLHQTACALALFLFPLAIWVLHNVWIWADLAILLPPLLLFLIDTTVLGGRVCFRIAYVWIPFLLFAITTALQLIPQQRGVDIAVGPIAVGVFFLLAAWCIAASLLVIVITTLTTKCGKRQQNDNDDDGVLTSNV